MHMDIRLYKVVSESSQTDIVISTLAKEYDRVGQGHTSASLCISLSGDTAL
jgi:hypothetical protein